MNLARMLSGCAALVAATTLAAAPDGCLPISAGLDSFPSTAKLVVDQSGFGEPFVVRLSSAGLPDAQLQRAAQVGDTIATELLQLELAGFHPDLGAIIARESPTQSSLGQISNVVLDGGCQLLSGDAFVDLHLELDLPGLGETWIPQQPIRLEAPLTGLPARDTIYEAPAVLAIALVEQLTLDDRGTLYYGLHHAVPLFPPAGEDCANTLFTADLELFGPPVTVSNLIGFGPTKVVRSDVIPGGTCVTGGGPCDSDADCPGFDSCRRDRLETELRRLDAAGFDIQLGNWSMSTLPDVGFSNCCDQTGGPGCTDPACEEIVCAQDPFCCLSDWDLLCAQLALGEPLCAENCIDPDANPSFGEVASLSTDTTYPAQSSFGAFFEFVTANEGTLHNAASIPLAATAPIPNLPPDPGTEYVRAAPIPILDANDVTVGEISNIIHKLDPPQDCDPLPAAGEDCFDARATVELTLPGCAREEVVLTGPVRLLRDTPGPGPGIGQDVIDTAMASLELSGHAGCAGSLTLRLSPATASSGAIGSLTPDEFFPADAFTDLQLELETPGGLLHGGPLHSATSINAIPADPGERYLGPGSPIALLDPGESSVGSIDAFVHELLGPVVCPEGAGSRILFTGPADGDFSVAVPNGGAGLDYDVVRGQLSSLRAGGGDFATAVCIETDTGPAVSDPTPVASGEAFYYLSRDGLGAFNGSWESGGAGQAAPRAALLPDCQ
jgi:hypothetical protein